MGKFSVIYDACVLYPAPLRDTLMRLAVTDLFKARWTEKIHDEWISNLAKNKNIPIEKLIRVKELMDQNVRDAKVEGFEYLIPQLELPDKDDRHVLAAAIHSKSDAIVTRNLKDFPADILSNFDIEAIHPDDFILYQFDLNTPMVIDCFKKQREALKSPKINSQDFLDILLQQELPQTVDYLESYSELI